MVIGSKGWLMMVNRMLWVLLIVAVVVAWMGVRENTRLAQKVAMLAEEVAGLEEDLDESGEVVRVYYNRIIDQETRVRELEAELEVLQEVLGWPQKEKELTFYAPLDPGAIKGVCYSGDPRVTSSGMESQPGVSIAMGPAYEYGQQVFIAGIGFREVHDRGGAIGNGNIDVMVVSRGEALSRGRYTERVWVKP